MRTRASALLCYKELLKALTRNNKGVDSKVPFKNTAPSLEYILARVFTLYILLLSQPLTLVI